MRPAMIISRHAAGKYASAIVEDFKIDLNLSGKEYKILNKVIMIRREDFLMNYSKYAMSTSKITNYILECLNDDN